MSALLQDISLKSILLALTLCALPPFSSPVPAGEPPTSNTATVSEKRSPVITYAACAACHGPIGEGIEANHAPRLAGQDKDFLRQQILDFQQGTRAPDPISPHASLMEALARQLSKVEIENILTEISKFPIMEPPQRYDGDRSHGQQLYQQNCSICHGDRGFGDPTTHMPRLNHQHSWYILRQLQRFRTGERGGEKGTAAARSMQFYSTLLPDNQAVLDVIAYLGRARLFPSPEWPPGTKPKPFPEK